MRFRSVCTFGLLVSACGASAMPEPQGGDDARSEASGTAARLAREIALLNERACAQAMADARSRGPDEGGEEMQWSCVATQVAGDGLAPGELARVEVAQHCGGNCEYVSFYIATRDGQDGWRVARTDFTFEHPCAGGNRCEARFSFSTPRKVDAKTLRFETRVESSSWFECLAPGQAEDEAGSAICGGREETVDVVVCRVDDAYAARCESHARDAVSTSTMTIPAGDDGREPEVRTTQARNCVREARLDGDELVLTPTHDNDPQCIAQRVALFADGEP